MPTPEHDRRRYARSKAHVPVELHVGGSETPIRTNTSDLSLGGCYIETMFPFPVGTELEMKVQIGGTLLVLATVVTCDPQFGNGIAFTKVLPEDFEELRAYLENLEKEEQAESAKEKQPGGT
jgi:PilZ domain